MATTASTCVWVGRLPQGLTRDELANLFRTLPGYYGTVLRAGRQSRKYVLRCCRLLILFPLAHSVLLCFDL